ncbi:MAG TPA: hypothetical protein VJ761_05360 [Ktedonobacteraceae bacterium]|nr:hypothetical protein [Ktedonobacteraceae bacterium]
MIEPVERVKRIFAQWSDLLQFTLELSIEEGLREINKEIGELTLELTGEYHPSGEVIEGSVIHPIEEETRLLP